MYPITRPITSPITSTTTNADGGSASWTLLLDFTYMDTSYKTVPSLKLDFVADSYVWWEAPTQQGEYEIWSGFAPWEPSLSLNFTSNFYQVQG